MNQQHEFDKLNAKLDAMDSKLDGHLERISKVEANQGWLKTGLMALFAWVSTNFYLGGK